MPYWKISIEEATLWEKNILTKYTQENSIKESYSTLKSVLCCFLKLLFINTLRVLLRVSSLLYYLSFNFVLWEYFILRHLTTKSALLFLFLCLVNVSAFFWTY